MLIDWSPVPTKVAMQVGSDREEAHGASCSRALVHRCTKSARVMELLWQCREWQWWHRDAWTRCKEIRGAQAAQSALWVSFVIYRPWGEFSCRNGARGESWEECQEKLFLCFSVCACRQITLSASRTPNMLPLPSLNTVWTMMLLLWQGTIQSGRLRCSKGYSVCHLWIQLRTDFKGYHSLILGMVALRGKIACWMSYASGRLLHSFFDCSFLTECMGV